VSSLNSSFVVSLLRIIVSGALPGGSHVNWSFQVVDWNPLAGPMGMIFMSWMIVPSTSPIQPGSGVLIWTPPWLAVVSIDDLYHSLGKAS
jgi:hypothetical protein